jgi:hypothetical protein
MIRFRHFGPPEPCLPSGELIVTPGLSSNARQSEIDDGEQLSRRKPYKLNGTFGPA